MQLVAAVQLSQRRATLSRRRYVFGLAVPLSGDWWLDADIDLGNTIVAMATGVEVVNPIVLVVEDEYWVRLAVAEELRLVGFDVIEARDADDAVRAIKAQHVDAVFSDLTMP